MSQLYRIATFYKALSLTPKGKYHFKICVGTACHVRGATQISDTIEQETKGSPKGLFSLEKVNCLGVCASGPVVVVNEEYYGNMDSKKTSKLINELKNK